MTSLDHTRDRRRILWRDAKLQLLAIVACGFWAVVLAVRGVTFVSSTPVGADFLSLQAACAVGGAAATILAALRFRQVQRLITHGTLVRAAVQRLTGPHRGIVFRADIVFDHDGLTHRLRVSFHEAHKPADHTLPLLIDPKHPTRCVVLPRRLS